MSYILDALRKADAQRERDASRGIHANPAPAGPAGGRAANGSRAGVWTAVAVGIAAAAGAGWYFMPGHAPAASTPPPVTASSLPPAVPVRMTPPQEVAKAIVPPAPPPAAAPAPVLQSPMRGLPQTNLAPGVSADERARQAREAAFANPAPQVAQANPQPQAQPAPVASGLPPDAPKVAISGGVYSPSPAQRMLIVNGQVFNEGSEVAPGVTVEKIEPRTAVLKFRGSRYTVAY